MMLKRRLSIACAALTTVLFFGAQPAHSHHKPGHNNGGGGGNGGGDSDGGGGNTGNQICHLNPDGSFSLVKKTNGHNKHEGDIEPTNGVCTLVIDNDGDSVSADLDCDDNNSDATEVLTYYGDLDADGFTAGTIESCGLPVVGNYVESPSAPLDCDDGNSAVTVGNLYYEDADNDTFTALNASSIIACAASAPYVALVESSVADCDDNDSSITPKTYYLDADGDGYTPKGADATLACNAVSPYLAESTSDTVDCDDSRGFVNPGAFEIFEDNNDIDENCDGVVEYTCPCLHGPASSPWLAAIQASDELQRNGNEGWLNSQWRVYGTPPDYVAVYNSDGITPILGTVWYRSYQIADNSYRTLVIDHYDGNTVISGTPDQTCSAEFPEPPYPYVTETRIGEDSPQIWTPAIAQRCRNELRDNYAFDLPELEPEPVVGDAG